MGTVGFVDASSKLIPPAGVMESDSAVKRHPKIHGTGVSFSPQHSVSLLIRQAEQPWGRRIAFRNISRDEIRLQNFLSILIKKHMLSR